MLDLEQLTFDEDTGLRNVMDRESDLFSHGRFGLGLESSGESIFCFRSSGPRADHPECPGGVAANDRMIILRHRPRQGRKAFEGPRVSEGCGSVPL